MNLRSILAPVLRAGIDHVPVDPARPGALRARLKSPRARLLIDVRKSTNYRFTRYGENPNSPHQIASQIYLETGRREAVREYLSRFLAARRPTSLADLLFGEESDALHPLTTLSPLIKFQPWRGEMVETPGFMGQREKSFGPVFDQYLEDEVVKQTAAVDSIRRQGYQPETHRRGYLKGYLLLAGGDYRFIAEDGKHRTGAMNALGLKEIAVRIAPNRPSVVDEREVDEWPLVKSGVCSHELALRLLHRHFE